MSIDKGIRDAWSPVEFWLDPASGVPVYGQLVHQVEHAPRPGVVTVPGGRPAGFLEAAR